MCYLGDGDRAVDRLSDGHICMVITRKTITEVKQLLYAHTQS